MTYDIETIRRQDADFRRRFNEMFAEVYGHSLQHELLTAKRWATQPPSPESMEAIKAYQEKIRHIKNLIEQ